ncbi:MAG: caspase family protein [Tildeniella nuda ZEHNDER 1965/U140]|jgi:uncharacterized caspase-like protein|nr:caspase family protein [Tildeniella nuda ZEHNDER 1965/U140]
MNNWAIVVGINKYEFLPEEAHLKFATRDAEEIRRFLCEQAGFPKDNVLLCSDNSAPINNSPTRPSRSYLRILLREKIPVQADCLCFFFAGHGAVGADKQDYLLPYDVDPNDLEETAISTQFVINQIRDRQARNAVLIFDMCRNESSYSSRSAGDAVGSRTVEIAKQQGIVTLFSCSKGERSYEIADLEHGAFTCQLLEGLKQHTIPRYLETYLKREVPELNRKHGKPTQTPLIIPESIGKCDLPLFPKCITEKDIESLQSSTSQAEQSGDITRARDLIDVWWRIAEFDSSRLQIVRQETERLQKAIHENLQLNLSGKPSDEIVPVSKDTAKSTSTSRTPVQRQKNTTAPRLLTPPVRPTQQSVETNSLADFYREPPSGCLPITNDFLDQRTPKTINKETLNLYFEGYDPGWEEILTNCIPHREIVKQLTHTLQTHRDRGFRVTLLVGPGGEGKSTALRQVVCRLVKEDSGFHIVWWEDPDISEMRNILSKLPKLDNTSKWLIVSDDPSSQVIESINKLRLTPIDRKDIQFLICCRDTVWENYGKPLDWGAQFTRKPMPKLKQEEAQQIVRAWKEAGALENKSEEEATQELLKKQKSDKAAFLAAMLQVRKNQTLEERVGRILEDMKCSPNGDSLVDAYACIAAMHAEGLKLLKPAILAKAIEYQPSKLQEDILEKLGNEIVASGSDTPILVRHQVIAETAVKILSSAPYSKKFEDDIYPRLAGAAETLSPSLSENEIMKWRYDFPKHFAENAENSRISVAICIAEALYKVERSHQLFTHLAQFYRKDNRLKQTTTLFRESSFTDSQRDRKFYSEWATAERDSKNYEFAAWLYAVALSDSTPKSLNKENAMVYLSNIGLCFFELHQHPTDACAKALVGSAQLGLRISKTADYRNMDKTISDLRKNEERARSLDIRDVPEGSAFENLLMGIAEVRQKVQEKSSQNAKTNLPCWIQNLGDLEFQALKKI